MDIRANKPVKHGFDHGPGGQDPIPGLGGGGIQFDTSPQEGGWLEVTTTSGGGLTGDAIYFHDTGGQGILLESEGDASVLGHLSSSIVGASSSITLTDGNAGFSTPGILIQGWGDTGSDSIFVDWQAATFFHIAGDAGTGKFVVVSGLPTSDPSGSGSNIIWNSAGTLKITP